MWFLLLISVFKVNFTVWSKLTTVENHLVRNAIVGLVVNHFGFSHIRPLKVVLTFIDGFKVVFTAWSNLTAVENRLVGKAIFSLVVTHIGFSHIRPIKVVFIHFKCLSHRFNFFQVGFSWFKSFYRLVRF